MARRAPAARSGRPRRQHRFPGLVALLEKIAEERRVRAKSVGHGTTAEVELPADPDPRWKPL